MPRSRVIPFLVVLPALVAAQAVAAASSTSPAPHVETVKVQRGGSVRIVVTGHACAAGKLVVVSGKPIASSVHRNGKGVLRVRAPNGPLRVSFGVPASTRPGRYPVTMRCLASSVDTVGTLIPGATVIVIVTA